MIHPSLHDWKQAKKSALLLAANIKNCELIQTPDGKTKRIILGKKVIDCATWFAAYSTLHRLRLDQIRGPEMPTPTQQSKPPPIPMAIILDD